MSGEITDVHRYLLHVFIVCAEVASCFWYAHESFPFSSSLLLFLLQQGSFAFVTVKGGRHEVPETAPGQAFELLTRLIDGTPF